MQDLGSVQKIISDFIVGHEQHDLILDSTGSEENDFLLAEEVLKHPSVIAVSEENIDLPRQIMIGDITVGHIA